MKKSNFIYLVPILSSFVFLTSCFGIKTKGNSPGPSNKLYETFYLENGITQHFVKPLPLQNHKLEKGNTIDFIVRKNEEVISMATVNMTVYSNEAINSKALVMIQGDNVSANSSDLNVIYTEKEEDNFKHRITFNVNQDEFLKILKSHTFKISIQQDSKIIILEPSSRALKRLRDLNSSILF